MRVNLLQRAVRQALEQLSMEVRFEQWTRLFERAFKRTPHDDAELIQFANGFAAGVRP